MISTDDRRCYRRQKLLLPMQIGRKDPQDTWTSAWMLDASPAGLLLELPDRTPLCLDKPVNLSLSFGENNNYKLGVGVIRHATSREDHKVLGIELIEEAPLLSGASMLGASSQVLEIKSLLPQISSSGLNILIRGETGTGKNVLAQLIHDQCQGKQHPFIRVNCPSIPDTLFESELFGHEKGAFTDARSSAPGYFRLAAEGTILLDEISEIKPHLQAKLLQVIEDKQFMSVGGQKLTPVRAKIIATTNVDLEKSVEKGRFRRDLFFRLSEMPIHLPPLRERKEDVIMLAHHFLLSSCQQFRRPFLTLSTGEVKILEKHSWPGNIRELENYMKQTALLGRFIEPKAATPHRVSENSVSENIRVSENMNVLEALNLPNHLLESQNSLSEITKKMTVQIERTLISNALEACNQNKTHTADRLGISYRTLLRKLEQHRLAEISSRGHVY